MTVLFPTGIGGGEGVGYGYKGKGVLIHSVTDANGMPVVAITTPAGGDERQQVLPMQARIRLATLKRGNPKRRPKTLAADLSSSAKNKNLTVDQDPRFQPENSNTRSDFYFQASFKRYDASWLRKKLRTKGIRPQIKKRFS